jgi:uncharacterized protein YdaU (DUF1376 family)
VNFYKRYMGDFAKKTAHLTMTERGAYDTLLDHYYAMERPLPPALSAIYQIAKAMTSLERKAVDHVVHEFFPVADDGLRHNKRADQEITKHQAQANTNRELGKLGGRPKKTESVSEHKTESDSESDSESKPNDKPNDNPTRVHARSREARSQKELQKHCSPADAGFVRFWEVWPKGPRKVSKGQCAQLWRKRGYERIADTIVSHVEAMKGTDEWRRGMVPKPMTYLNQERWDGAEIHAFTEEKRMVI